LIYRRWKKLPLTAECDHPRKRWKLSEDRTEVLCPDCNVKVAEVRPVLMRWLGTGKVFKGSDPKPVKKGKK
jgi:hypothetical protein